MDVVGEEVGVLRVLVVGDGVPVHHVLVLVGRVEWVGEGGDSLGPLAHFRGGELHLIVHSGTGD